MKKKESERARGGGKINRKERERNGGGVEREVRKLGWKGERKREERERGYIYSNMVEGTITCSDTI